MDGAEGLEGWMGGYLQPNLFLLSSLFVCAKSRVHLWPFWNPCLSPISDHGCNSKSQLTPSICLSALLLTFSLLFSTLPLVGLVIYVGLYDGLSCPCHLSNLISSPCSLPTPSTELLQCYSTYLVTRPNPRGSLTDPEFMTPAVNSY